MPATVALLADERDAPRRPRGTHGSGALEVVRSPGDAGEATATSVDKALAVLEAFRGPGTVLGVTEVARRGNLSKSTAHRMLGLLVDRGYVEREGIGYALGSLLFELGNSTAYTRARSFRAIAMPYMIELLQATSAAVHLATLIDDDVLFLERVFGHRGIRSVPDVGSRIPAVGSAPGDVIRAFSGAVPVSPADARSLAQIRHLRVARRECGVGHTATCVSAPIVAASSGIAVAALSLVLRREQCRAPGLENELQAAATRIGEVL